MSPITTDTKPTLHSHEAYVVEVEKLSERRRSHENAVRRRNELQHEYTELQHKPGTRARRRKIEKELEELGPLVLDFEDERKDQEKVVRQTEHRLQPELREAYVAEHIQLATIVAEKIRELLDAGENLQRFENDLHAFGISIAAPLKAGCRLLVPEQLENYFRSDEIYDECKEHRPAS